MKDQFNLNSILATIALAAMMWIGNATVDNGKKLSSMESVSIERAIGNVRVEKKLDDLAIEVSRQRDSILKVEMQMQLRK